MEALEAKIGMVEQNIAEVEAMIAILETDLNPDDVVEQSRLNYLRVEKRQLRDEKRQLREEKLLLLQQAQGAGVNVEEEVQRRVKQKLEEPDSTADWAKGMLACDPASLPLDAAGVWAFLSAQPPKLLPLAKRYRDQLLVNPSTSAAAAQCTVECADAYRFSGLLAEILDTTQATVSSSEMDKVVSLIGQLDTFLVDRVLVWGGETGFSSNRNVVDPSGTTTAKKRPDYMVWLNNALVYKTENKLGGSLQVPLKECGAKTRREWNTLTSGSMRYLLCCATAGFDAQFCLVSRGSDVATPLGHVLQLNNVGDRLRMLQLLVNAARLMLLQRPLLPSEVLPIGRVLTFSNGTSILISNSTSALKKVEHFSTRGNVNPSFKVLREIYTNTEDVEGLVHSEAGPSYNKKQDVYKVELRPLGYRDRPGNESELRQALRRLLRCLCELHRRGYVHRDIRWPNLLRDSEGRWFLADLEGAGKAGAAPGTFACQDQQDILDGGCHTTRSDMLQVGRLLRNVSELLSADGKDLVTRLTCANAAQRLTADEALDHAWLAVA